MMIGSSRLLGDTGGGESTNLSCLTPRRTCGVEELPLKRLAPVSASPSSSLRFLWGDKFIEARIMAAT
jgi:hypothetical protein